MPAGLVLAAALLFGPAPAEAPARPVLAAYDVAESVRTLTPAGERVRGTAGTVAVAGGRARWDLPHGTFPRSSAAVALADGALVTLLDTKERISAAATPEDFTSLFRGRPAPEGSAAAALKDVSATVAPAGSGRTFQGRPTTRWALEASWTLVLSTTGRIARVATSIKGTIDALDEPAARSAFDGLARLLPARGAAAEALDAELARVNGLPVSASFEVVSKSTVEMPGMPSGTEPPPRPVETRQTITRNVTNLSIRAGAPRDDALFVIPEGFHARSLDRVVPEESP